MLTSHFAVRSVEGDGGLSLGLQHASQKCLALVSDNLIVNDGMFLGARAAIAMAASVGLDGYDYFPLLSVACVAILFC